jgi:hypothetical protein
MASEARSAEVTKTPVPEHVRAMETALRLLHAVGRALESVPSSRADLPAIARPTERSIVALLDAFDSRRDPVAAIRDSLVAIDEASAAVMAASALVVGLDELSSWLASARGWLVFAESHLARFPAPVAAFEPWTAAPGLPKTHAIPRATIRPFFRVADPLPQPAAAPVAAADLSPAEKLAFARERATLVREEAARRREAASQAREARRRAAQAEAPAPGFVPGTPRSLTRAQRVAARARELFEEVATAGLHRTPLLGDEWRGMDVADQRMLRAIDAIVALGGEAIASIEPLCADSPAKDPAHGFAATFVLGCLSGRDALAAIERLVRQLGPTEPEMRDALAGALKLAAHPDLERMLRGWVVEEDAGMRSLAVDVLGHRGLLVEDELVAALQDASADVVAAALRWGALGPSSHRVHLRGAMLAHESTEHVDLLTAHAWAIVLADLADGLVELGGWLGTPRESFAVLPLALAGDHETAKQLVARMSAAPTPPSVQAVGFSGAPEALPALVALLADPASSSEVKIAAAFALQRITGHEPFDDVDIPPEKLEAEAPPTPPGIPPRDEPLARKVSHKRDMPEDGAPDRLKLPSPRAEVWQRYLAREGQRYEGARRFRRGQPYTPDISLDELDRYAVTPVERRALFAELVIKTGEVVPFDPLDFVRVQEAKLRAWAPLANRASSRPGSWSRSGRRS